jgi:hypothetical protein
MATTSPEKLQEGYKRVVEHMRNNALQAFPVVLVFIDEEKKQLQIGMRKQTAISRGEVSTQLQTLLNDIPFEVGESETLTDVKRSPSQGEQSPQGTEKVRPLQGGTRITVRNSPWPQGTLGVGVMLENEIIGFLTSGHVVPASRQVGQPSPTSEDLIGKCILNGLDNSNHPVDAAVVTLYEGVPYALWSIWIPGGQVLLQVSDNPRIGDKVTMYGSVSPAPTTGTVQRQATIKSQEGYLLEDIYLADYARKQGDSGAAVVRMNAVQGNRLVGIHQGCYTWDGAVLAVIEPMDRILSFLPSIVTTPHG